MSMKRPRITRRAALHAMGTALGGGLTLTAIGQDPSSDSGAVAGEVRTPVLGERVVKIPAWHYQHFDADFRLDVPERSFGGWQRESLEFSLSHTAVVSMHAWDMGTFDEFPGWWRVVPWVVRAQRILRDVFPGLLEAVRAAHIPLFHVVGGGEYYKDQPGYQKARRLAGPDLPAMPTIDRDALRDRLDAFRRARVFPGEHNEEDISRGFKRVDFAREARPREDEGIAENGRQLFALCNDIGVNHLIYCGFAIDGCLLLSPGGMADMQQYGLLCSAFRQATTAIENRETARGELAKEMALWRVALSFGFVFDVGDFVAAIRPQ